MTDPFIVEPLTARHQRAAFSCGVPALDRYFREQVSQDIRRNVTNCFVATSREGVIAAYYTFAASSIMVAEMPAEAARKLPRYPALPAALIGRLAVEARFRRRGLGGLLLADAVARARRADAAVFALTVEAKDDSAATFYAHYGFRSLLTNRNRMFLVISNGFQPG